MIAKENTPTGMATDGREGNSSSVSDPNINAHNVSRLIGLDNVAEYGKVAVRGKLIRHTVYVVEGGADTVAALVAAGILAVSVPQGWAAAGSVDWSPLALHPLAFVIPMDLDSDEESAVAEATAGIRARLGLDTHVPSLRRQNRRRYPFRSVSISLPRYASTATSGSTDSTCSPRR